MSRKLILMSALLLASSNVMAAAITNGNFADGGSCSLSGWTKYTEDGDVNGSDFSTSGAAPNCSANLSVGDWDTSFAYVNGLSQELDLTATAGNSLLLTMDFSVDSILTSQDTDFWADILTIALVDDSGNKFNQLGKAGEFLFDMDIDGFASQHLELELDNSFANQSGWSLEFLMLDTFDQFGSTLSISHVALSEVSSQVPEPGSSALLALGLVGLLGRRKLISHRIYNS
ncbi:PEP-CTERM sorting domain-containing protein [Neptunicella sp.]|uniref:PEP-CTERM sorting domain-containing protein n=1 Tax=Neptunicella sp. TaxID=2125986 RepID=UPI003F6912B4